MSPVLAARSDTSHLYTGLKKHSYSLRSHSGSASEMGVVPMDFDQRGTTRSSSDTLPFGPNDTSNWPGSSTCAGISNVRVCGSDVVAGTGDRITRPGTVHVICAGRDCPLTVVVTLIRPAASSTRPLIFRV